MIADLAMYCFEFDIYSHLARATPEHTFSSAARLLDHRNPFGEQGRTENKPVAFDPMSDVRR